MDWRNHDAPPDDMRPVLAFIQGNFETPDEWRIVYFKRGAYRDQLDDHLIIVPTKWAELEKP